MQRVNTDECKPELTFYEVPKNTQFNYEQFKEHAKQRHIVLRKLENDIRDTTGIRTMAEDVDSHFCMKLVCAQTKWSCKWFVAQETALFSHRLSLDMTETKNFHKEKVWPHLSMTRRSDCIDNETFYSSKNHNPHSYTDELKVHFTKCSDLIAKRAYTPQLGYLEMNEEVLTSFLTETFRTQLEEQMRDLYEKVIIDTDERLHAVNRLLFSSGNSDETAPVGDIMKLSAFFPLCIKGLLEKLKTQRHLKYQDRQMLCLFLKDIKMGMNECIEFFRSNFKCTADEFNKEYLYSIRHNYGMEGKRANYQSFTCAKIIGFSNDRVSFGCPFINNSDFVKAEGDIEDLGKNAVSCCKKVGEKVAGKVLEEMFVSPAEYFRLLVKEKTGASE